MTERVSNNQGWIKLHRKLLENPIVQKSQYWHLWTFLLLKASHEESHFIWNSKRMVLRPGQVLTGRKALSEDTQIPPSTIERILTYLESEHQIEQQTTNKFRIITIKNWEKYQNRQEEEHQTDNKRTTSGQQADTYKKVKKVKNVKKEEEDHRLCQIFTRWNSYKGRTVRKRNKENQEISVAWRGYKLRADHSLPPEAKKAITETLEAGHSVQDVCGAIDNYAKVLLGADYWWTHVWPLSTFLMVKYERLKDAEHKFWQFLPDSFIEENYLTEAARRKRADNAKGPKPYELVKQQAENQRTKDEHKQTA